MFHNDLTFGTENSVISLVFACNPYCNPCAETHKEMDELLLAHGDKIRVHIRFVYPKEAPHDKKTIAVKEILHKISRSPTSQISQFMLSDWFENMDMEKWRNKWDGIIDDIGVESTYNAEVRMSQHMDWVQENHIRYTPMFFLNGKEIPNRYTLKDIRPMIPHLIYYFTRSTGDIR